MRMPALRRLRMICRVAWVLLVAGVLVQPAVSQAQVTPSPTNSLTTAVGTAPSGLGGTQYNITDGTRPGGGSNLFHSFGGFNIGSNDIANFSNTRGPGIMNVLGRVTGGLPSNISGQIQTSNFGITPPNLYLINPAGIMFGPGASVLNVGSFHVSTANYVRFPDLPDGTPVKFFATDSPLPASGLTVNPVAFGFLGPNPVRIVIEGSSLQVGSGQTLSVVAGNAPFPVPGETETGLKITGATLTAPSGRVQIASVGSAGEVGLVDPTGAPTLDVSSFSRLGQIDITGGSVIDASDVSGIGGGTVVIRGGRLMVDSSQISANTAGDVDGAPVGIDIQLAKETALPDGTATGGTLTLTNFASVGTTTSGLGRGGNIQITASQVQIDGSSVTTSTFGDGNAGNLSLNAQATILPDGTTTGGTLNLTNGASVATSTSFGAGRSGDINVAARDLLIDGSGSSVANSTFLGTGFSGDVTITAERLTLTNGGTILSENQSFDPAHGGNVTVQVAESIAMSSGAGILSTSTFDGDGGNLTVSGATPESSARSLTMDSLATISSAAFGDGRGGSIGIKVERLSISNGASVSSNGGLTRPGGIITVDAAESTLISGVDSLGNISGIFSSSGGALVGSISLTTGTLNLRDGALIQSGSVLAVAGDIKVQASGDILISNGAGILSQTFDQPVGQVSVSANALTLDNGFITTSTLGPGRAGAIEVKDVKTLSLLNGGQIVSSSEVLAEGDGGSVNIAASQSTTISGRSPTGLPVSPFSTDPSSGIFSTAAATGNAGQIVVTTPMLSLSDGGKISVATSGVGRAGDIGLNVGNFTLASGARVDSSTTAAGRGGDVALTATTGASITGVGSGLFSTASSTGDAGQVTVAAQTLALDDGARISVATSGAGNAGNIGLTVANTSLTGGARVDSSTTGAGAGGAITLTTTDAASSVAIAGVGSGLFSTAASTGNAGTITVAAATGVPAPTVTMADGGRISVATSGAGNAGDITLTLSSLTSTGGARVDSSTTGAGRGGNVALTAAGPVAMSGVDSAGQAGGLFSTTQGSGDAGQILVTTSTLTLGGGAQIASSSEGAATTGRGGSVTVTAPGSVALAGAGSGLLSTAEGFGDAGQITVTTPTLELKDGGAISVATSGAGRAGDIGLTLRSLTATGGARVDSSTTGAGRGGIVTVNAAGPATISSGAGLFSTAAGGGAGGDLNIRAAELQLLDGAIISANSSGTDTALAGNVNIVAGSLFRMANSTITTQAAVADGGNISITTSGSLVRLTDSQITTSVQSGVGKGGNITIGSALHPTDFILLDTSQVRADAFGGPGGNINIFANVYLTNDSVVSASSALSTPGTINIQASITNVSGSLTQLPTSPLEAAALLRASCAARLAGGKSSSLVLAGREGLPLDPSGLLPSPLEVEGPVAALFPSEEYPWLGNLLRVTQLSLDPNCSK